MSRSIDSLIMEAEGMTINKRKRVHARARKPDGGRRSKKYREVHDKVKEPAQELGISIVEIDQPKAQEFELKLEEVNEEQPEAAQNDNPEEEVVIEHPRIKKPQVFLDFNNEFTKPYTEPWTGIGVSFLNLFGSSQQVKKSRSFPGWSFLFNEDRSRFDHLCQITNLMRHVKSFFNSDVIYFHCEQNIQGIFTDALVFNFGGEEVTFSIESIPNQKAVSIRINAKEYPEMEKAILEYLPPLGYIELNIPSFVNLIAAVADFYDKSFNAKVH